MLGSGRGEVSGRGRQRNSREKGKGKSRGEEQGQANGSSFFQHLRNAKNEDNGVGSCCLIRWMGERGSRSRARHLG